ncbi:uncharacterized protein BO97DRAFT_447765 [Aspergillus homomorphus CBS 101889]|uniref:Glutamine amidotransferase domain-containing protein n=1 Tax=Aspergillus homomorphus (strain CBS 101889) TaxID=1450537 RepID=A0A395IBM0_ASPHC|nr:hypothetical protein BO97DRAFT_447765 [Aspergillus homomorphus CBS 101889]RAL17385.1 hypothetical protein BO97DRAFT_447765 [Aspergillus homomorphus CBS 101889]
MYKPASPRPKRNEYFPLCDEAKPTCGTCARLGRFCESVKLDFKFRVVTPSVPETNRSPPQHSRQRHHQSALIPSLNLDLIHSLQHTDRDIFYSTYWEDQCLSALHPISRSILQQPELPALKDAILALSSCSISRLHAEKTSPTPFLAMGAFSPSLTHQTRSQLYYSSAMRKFISPTPKCYGSNIKVALTILVLFGYIEASIGNFVTGDHLFRALLTVWLQSQFLVWWARAYFSSPDIQLHLPPIALPRAHEENPSSLHERRAVTLSIIYQNTSASSSMFFQPHEAALSFAYHIVTRIMQCTTFLNYLPSRDPQNIGIECMETESWIRLLLRIVQGIDMRSCILRNSYTIGFSGLLLAVSLRCQDLSLGVVLAINCQRSLEYDVFGVSQLTDDGGGDPKFTCYNSQRISVLLFHGKCKATGELFTEFIDWEIPEFHVREVAQPGMGFIHLAENHEMLVNQQNTVLSFQAHPEVQAELAKKMLLDEDDVYNGDLSQQELGAHLAKLDRPTDGLKVLKRVVEWARE